MQFRKAYAKINLGLQIVRKREDGYHDIDTVFHRVGIHDELYFSKCERGIDIVCTDAALPLDSSNLCYAAAGKLFRAAGYDGGVRIELIKRIPYGAGLGGGSSDAAATLRALNEIFEFHLPDTALAAIGSSLGADVPYFLHQGSASARGIGDILEYFALSLPYWVVLVSPPVHVSTPWAYSQLKLVPAPTVVPLQQTLVAYIDQPQMLVSTIRNDFEPVVFGEFHEIASIKDSFYQQGADFALMSGSGSTVFGLFPSEAPARECAGHFGELNRVFITPPHFAPAE